MKGSPQRKGVTMPEVKLNLPEGMTQEKFMAAFETFQKARVNAQVRDKGVRAAIKDLIKLHQDEYDKLVKKYTPK